MESAVKTRLPSLDGWRAIAILSVLGAHSRGLPGVTPSLDPVFKWAFDGDLGVRLFFIISGFLITYLLARENEKAGQISLKHFYLRRGLRILPVYFTFLIILAGLQLFTPYTQSGTAWLVNLTFTTNLVKDFSTMPWTSGHLWTLAVEEQFYLIWPSLIVFFSLCKNSRLAFGLLSVPILLAPVFRVMTHTGHYPSGLSALFADRSTLNYFDSLAFGCLGALWLARNKNAVENLVTKKAAGWMTAGLLLIVVPYCVARTIGLGIFTVPLGPTCQAIGFSMLLLQSLHLPALGFYRMLNWAPVRQIGVLSYSIYIWQQIFSTPPRFFGLQPVWWLSFPGWLVPVFAVAAISYYGLERPLLALRLRYR